MLIPVHFDELSVGLQVEKDNKLWTIVRLLKDSITLYKTPEGEFQIVRESIAQLLNEKGEVDFEIYDTFSIIPNINYPVGLASISWRK